MIADRRRGWCLGRLPKCLFPSITCRAFTVWTLALPLSGEAGR